MFFTIKHPHAHFQYVCSIPAKYSKDTQRAAVGGVNFTKCALSSLFNMCSDQKLTKLYMLYIYPKLFFSDLNFHMHIANMSVAYLQSIKRIHRKL